MKEELNGYGWLDHEFFDCVGKRKSKDPDVYSKWLDALNDSDFLAAYNRVTQRIRELD
jgi:hypothetical protein